MVGNLVILGDSYSTFSGYVPEDSLAWYSSEYKENTDVFKVEETWWHRFVEKTGANLVRNQSASGSAICYTGWSGYQPDYSFIGRFEKLINEGIFEDNHIDTLIFFGGTNDNWIPSPLGEIKHEKITDEDKKCVLPAICYLFDKIAKNLPGTQVIVLINDLLSDAIADTLENEAVRNGFKPLRLENIDKTDGHPNIKGMTQISEQLIGFLKGE